MALKNSNGSVKYVNHVSLDIVDTFCLAEKLLATCGVYFSSAAPVQYNPQHTERSKYYSIRCAINFN